MNRFRIGDRIRIFHKGNGDSHIYTILDILEDYDGRMYWLRNEKGSTILEMETKEIIFEKINPVTKTTI